MRVRGKSSRRPPNLQAQAKQRSTRQRAGVGSPAEAEQLRGESGACLQVLGAAHDRLRTRGHDPESCLPTQKVIPTNTASRAAFPE